jgi:putative toxin-antitoxin system antitoxin component (TIGR02293 family)
MNIHPSVPTPLDYKAIEKGVSAREVEALIRKGALDAEDVYRAIPERTFKRRLAGKAKLRIEEADAIARILRVNALARWAFDNDEESARFFLSTANPMLGDRTPRVMAATDAGAREVEALLFRFAAGDYS